MMRHLLQMIPLPLKILLLMMIHQIMSRLLMMPLLLLMIHQMMIHLLTIQLMMSHPQMTAAASP